MQNAIAPVLSVQPQPRAYWQTAPCPEWCSGNHTDDQEDRNHWSEWRETTTLTLHQPYVNVDVDGERVVEPCQLEVFLVQGDREIAPRILLGEEPKDPFELTDVEAEQLGHALLRAVRMARGNR